MGNVPISQMNRIAMEGQFFGRLLVLMRGANIGPHTAYHCLCKCGTEVIVRAQSLRKGETTSCGCWRKEKMANTQRTHGMTRTPTYNSWRAMLSRCQDVTHPQFADYGGRGIVVSDRWRASFQTFLADMGERPEGTTLDRFPNPDGNYEPGNTRWATRIQQRHNRRDSCQTIQAPK